ncbi:MAG: gamma-glutamyltransferase [Calditrichia bacterium]
MASADIHASQVGVEIMKAGGNAADAATAVAMALAVVYPQAGNLGGGGFLLYRQDSGKIYALDFRETAPALSGRNMYLDSLGNLQSDKSLVGGLAVGVPGTVKGFYQFHRKFGALPWSAVLEPAIHLAEDGFIVNEFLAERLEAAAPEFKKFPPSAAVFLPGGTPLKAGERLYQKELARSLKAIAIHGDQAFYDGEIAREIVKSTEQFGGIISLQDLENYQAVEREPIIIDYSGYNIISFPPPSSGGVVLAGILNSLSDIDFSRFPFHSPQQIALFTDLEKRYFAIRNQLLGDPGYVGMPLDKLLSPEFAKSVLARINYKNPEPASEISAAGLLDHESRETTHFSVVDSLSNAVSVTYTLNGNFGSKLVAGSTGILLNNEMDDFAAKPGSPNMFGLVQGEANSIAPGKRMLSSMSPVILTENNQLIGALGSPGGPTIITTVLQVLVNLINYHMPLPQAVGAGRTHDQWLPDSVYYESGKFENQTLNVLEHWGYNLVKRENLGDVQAFWRDNKSGWQVCSDPRGNGFPKGY